MTKEKRQRKIRDLIQAKNVSSQNELAELLSKARFSVTQSSVSRDLEQLGIIKINNFYALPQTSGGTQKSGFLSLTAAGANLIVVCCESGLASAVAVKIDAANITEIVGTIAGDDTIFIAVKNTKAQKSAIKKVWRLFEK
ncbi:MAG: arginine repressor [Pyrinomonadaceae bacterium]